MANVVYPKYKEACMNGSTDVELLTADVVAILIDTADYTYNAAHDFLSDVLVAARIATSNPLTTKSVTDGVFNCDDWTWPTVSGDSAEAFIIVRDTTVEATSRLVAYVDTGQTGLPVTPNGGNIAYTVAASGVFTI